jgi:hypothetical protein
MARALWVALSALIGFAVAVPICYGLISKFSSSHDSSVEAAMTSIFVFGPLGAIIGGVIAFVRTMHKLS